MSGQPTAAILMKAGIGLEGSDAGLASYLPSVANSGYIMQGSPSGRSLITDLTTEVIPF